ncbi:hypothetical protein NL676_018156 [Syzygium grande]|nr:hypothetical protein NL676_018156 [Syzygium grande]
MPPIFASPISRYGVLVRLEGDLNEFTNPSFPLVVFIHYTATLWVDLGSLRGEVPYHFVSIFVLVDGHLEGLIPYNDGGSSDDGGNGEE